MTPIKDQQNLHTPKNHFPETPQKYWNSKFWTPKNGPSLCIYENIRVPPLPRETTKPTYPSPRVHIYHPPTHPCTLPLKRMSNGVHVYQELKGVNGNTSKKKMGLFIVIESINLVACTWHTVVLRWSIYMWVGSAFQYTIVQEKNVNLNYSSLLELWSDNANVSEWFCGEERASKSGRVWRSYSYKVVGNLIHVCW